MSPETTLERALTRYGDRIYRIALLDNPHAGEAAKATATAFRALDWTTVANDDQLEERLIAALPRPTRRRRQASLPPIPAEFWQLPASTRLAVGLRLTRGYSSATIAAVLGTTTDSVQQEVLGALAGAVGPDASQECSQLRLLSLDDRLVGRVHRLTCEPCRVTTGRIAETATTLTIAIEQATARLHLPRTTEQQILDAIRAQAKPTRPPRRPRALLPIAAVIVAVAVLTTMLILPRASSVTRTDIPAQAQQTAREVLATAIARYGAPMSGVGVVHQRFEITSGQPSVTYIAEAWTDAANPGRHRMQITVNNVLQEWQAGDGASALRYMSNGSLQHCGRTYPDSRIRAGDINRWKMNGQDQAMMRTSRWQFGPWAVGRQYLEQAQDAKQLRSLGSVVEDGNQILTLTAEDTMIDGTLLLKLDANDLTLKQVNLVTEAQGTTSTLVPWHLVSSEQSETSTTVNHADLSILPLQPRPREYDRPLPLLDPACPLWDSNHAYSLTSVLKQGTTPVVGLSQVPSGIERIYLAGRRRMSGQVDGENDYLRLIYVGTGKRLTLLALPGLATETRPMTIQPDSITSGQWMVRLRSTGIGGLRGDARPTRVDGSSAQPAFWFVAEGWSETEVLDLLADVHQLDLSDVSAQRSVLYEPVPGPATAGSVGEGQ